MLSALSYGNNASHDYSYDLGISPSLPPSFSRLLFRPAPTQQSSKSSHTLCVAQSTWERIVIDCYPPHLHDKAATSKKKRTCWVQSKPNFSVAHKSTPENQIQQDLTTCRDAGASHTGKERRFSNKHCNNVLHEDEEPITGGRDDHYGWRLMPSWTIHPFMRWLLGSS